MHFDITYSNGSGIPWAIFISAGAAIAAAFIGGWWQRRIHRQVLTYKEISDLMWDGDYIKARQRFIAMRNSDGNALISLAQPEQQTNEDAAAVRQILNEYELVAIGLFKGVLDEGMMRDFYRTTLVQDFAKITPYINEIRRKADNKALYVNYQKLADRWGKNGTEA